jgi:uncharacterized Tic20 family protein
MDNYGYDKDEKGHVQREAEPVYQQPQPTDQPPMQQPVGQSVGQPPMSAEGELSKDVKMWGMLCHLAALAGLIGIPFGNVIGPLVIWLIKKEVHPFIDEQGKKVLNFQISMMIYIVISILLMFFVIGFILLAGIAILNLIMIIMNSIKANNGEETNYPLSIQFIK